MFVPLARATAGPGYLKVTYARRQVKDVRLRGRVPVLAALSALRAALAAETIPLADAGPWLQTTSRHSR